MMRRRFKPPPVAAALQAATLLVVAGGLFGILINEILRHEAEMANVEMTASAQPAPPHEK